MNIDIIKQSIKDTVDSAVESAKYSVKDVSIDSIKKSGEKVLEQTKTAVKGAITSLSEHQEKIENPVVVESTEIECISTKNAIKIIYFLMAADGEIFHNEEEKFDAIGLELDAKFMEYKSKLIEECQKALGKIIDSEDYYDVIQDGVEDALRLSKKDDGSFITPELLLWDMLTVAYSDNHYDKTERRLIKYVVRKLNIDKSVLLEMESCILTLIDIDEEIAWIKTTSKPYLTIEAMVNELVDRKNTINKSVYALITL